MILDGIARAVAGNIEDWYASRGEIVAPLAKGFGVHVIVGEPGSYLVEPLE
jgi:hypothetical protein